MLLRGNDVVVKDLNSTNGTFINGQQVTTEAVLKPGQMLRLGQVEVRLDTARRERRRPAQRRGAKRAPTKKPVDSTMVISKGVSLEQLEQGPQGGFDTTQGRFHQEEQQDQPVFHLGRSCILRGHRSGAGLYLRHPDQQRRAAGSRGLIRRLDHFSFNQRATSAAA